MATEMFFIVWPCDPWQLLLTLWVLGSSLCRGFLIVFCRQIYRDLGHTATGQQAGGHTGGHAGGKSTGTLGTQLLGNNGSQGHTMNNISVAILAQFKRVCKGLFSLAQP